MKEVNLNNHPEIEKEYAELVIKIVSYHTDRLIRSIRDRTIDSEIEQNCNDYYLAIKRSSDRGITKREMGRVGPFAKHQQRDRTAIINTLIDAGKIEYIAIPKNKQGRLREAYVTTDSCISVKREQTASKFKSVYWDNDLLQWVVQAKTPRENEVIELGYSDTEGDAISKYNEFTAKHPGKFPKYNK